MKGLEVALAEDLAALEPAWDELFREAGATPFQSPAWALPWWDVFRPGEPFVVTVREAGRLVGLAPLYVERGPAGARLLPIGVALSDALDVLLHPAAAERAADALVAFLRERAPGPLCLEELPPDAAAHLLPTVAGDLDRVERASACPVLTLPGPDEPLRRAVPAKQLRNLRQARTRAAARGLRTFEADAANLSDLLDAWLALHDLRWGEDGVLADERVRAFHRRAAPRLWEAGLLRMRAVALEGRIAAVYHGFSHRGRASAYLASFDPAFAWESPGTIVVGDAIEAAWREGAREFHFLRGQEPYKYLWGARDRWNVRRTIHLGPGEGPEEVRSALRWVQALIASRPAGPELAGVACRHPRAPELVRALLDGMDHERPASSPEAGVARWARAFDRAARISPEGSVAVYSLGDPELLRAATAEVVARLRDGGLLAPDRTVLDLGCGIGRIAEALAGEVAAVTGLDVSAEMLAHARRRCAEHANVRFVQGSGLDLAGLADASFDLVLAVDSFPYLVSAGPTVVERHFEEVRRVLRPGGAFVVLQFSYRGDPARDRADVLRLADRAGLVVLRAGVRLFAGWDGLTFHLQG